MSEECLLSILALNLKRIVKVVGEPSYPFEVIIILGLLRILCKVQTRVKQMLAGRGVSLLFNITETRQKIKP